MNFLFVYGTLMSEGNEFAEYLKANSHFHSKGKLKGKLYDIGEYPGAVLTDGDDYIHGTILQLNNAEKVLKLIDDYEGFGADHPQPNEFVRTLTDVNTDNGMLNCWIYLYNLPVHGLPQITTGKYL